MPDGRGAANAAPHFFPRKGSYYFLWCPEHGTFWDEMRHGRCEECEYRTYDMHPISERFHAILKEMGELHDKKQADYGTDEDPLANVRASTDWGIPAWQGAMIRANDKIKRMQSFAKKGKLENEPLIDAFMDLAVYAIIGRILYEEETNVRITDV